MRDMHISIEYMDTKRLNTPAYLNDLAKIYQSKYGATRFDAVLTSDDNALSFAMTQQKEGFLAGVPIVFCGVNDLPRHGLDTNGNRAVTGVVEQGEFAPTLHAARKLFPKRNRLCILSDRTPTGEKNLAELMQVLATPSVPYDITVWQDLHLDALKTAMTSPGEDAVILFISFWQDAAGKAVSPTELASLFEATPAPVFGRSEWMMGRGMLGGKCVSGFHQGREAAIMAAALLAGEEIQSIPIERKSPNVFMFDYRKLRKHHLALSQLPSESLVLNRPKSIYREHRKAVLAVLTVLLTLLGLVVALTTSMLRRRRAEAALLATEQRYQQAKKMEAIGQLSAGVAHDFNNLLTPITGYTEMLLDDAPQASPSREPLKAIQHSALLARDLTQELLSFGRRQVLDMRVIDPTDPLLRVQTMLRRMTRDDIEFQFNIASDLYPIKADPSQLVQICLNLAVNASDAMPTGGKLTVDAMNVSLNTPELHHNQTVSAGDYLNISFTDTGDGIDDDDADHVFEPFFTTKEKGKGTGLGLASVHGIVAQHAGYVWFESEQAAGTTFKVIIPRSTKKLDDITTAPSAPPPTETANGCGFTVLVAEDDAMVRRLACTALLKHGYTVIEAVDGQDALEKARNLNGTIDLLLSDVVMPRMNGEDLSRAIQELYSEVKVLFMSGYEGNILGRHGLTGEDLQLIRKPFSVKELLTRVQTTISRPDGS